MTDTTDKNVVYLKESFQVAGLVLSACACICLLKLLSLVLSAWSKKGTGFDDAVKLLIHYPSSIKAIAAFMTAMLLVGSLTILLYPSDLGELVRKYVVIPGLRISEHMFGLASGVAMGWLITDSFELKMTLSVLPKALFVIGALFVIALGLAWLATFMAEEFEKLASKISFKYRLPIFLSASTLVIWAALSDQVWNYKPLIDAAH